MSDELEASAGAGGTVRCPVCSRLLAELDAAGAVVLLNGSRSRVVLRDADIQCLRCSVLVTIRSGRVGAEVSPPASGATWSGSSARHHHRR